MPRQDFHRAAIVRENDGRPKTKLARDHVDFKGCFTANFAVFQRENLNQFFSTFFKSIRNLVQNLGAQFAIVLPIRRLESTHGGPSGSFDIGATCVRIATNPLARCRIEAVGVLAGVNPLTVDPILCRPILPSPPSTVITGREGVSFMLTRRGVVFLVAPKPVILLAGLLLKHW